MPECKSALLLHPQFNLPGIWFTHDVLVKEGVRRFTWWCTLLICPSCSFSGLMPCYLSPLCLPLLAYLFYLSAGHSLRLECFPPRCLRLILSPPSGLSSDNPPSVKSSPMTLTFPVLTFCFIFLCRS